MNMIQWVLAKPFLHNQNKMLNQKVSGAILRMRKMCSNSVHRRRYVCKKWNGTKNPNRKLIAHAETFHVHQMLY